MNACVRAWMVIAIVLASVACGAESFTCSEDGECVLGGEPGVCVAGNCAYVDATCASGYRYAAGLGNALASECVEEGDAPPGSDTEDGTSSSGASTTIDPSMTSSSSTTESVDESTSTTSMSSTGANDCTNPSCESCLDCAVGSMGSCAKEYALCEYIQGCLMGHACLEACVSGMVCEECCTGLSPSAIEAMYALIACQQTACNDNCGTFPPADCDPS